MAHSSTSSSRRPEGSLRGGYVVEQDWEAKEALRQRELEEARARAAQMEKTMRWWSDCTANWREKWSKVRNERNKAREEAKLLRSKLEAALKDVSTYKREKLELESHNEQMRRELERIHLLLLKHAGQWDNQLLEALDTGESDTNREGDDRELEKDSALETGGSGEDLRLTAEEEDQLEQGQQQQSVAVAAPSGSSPGGESSVGGDTEALQQKISMLQLRLEEVTKTLHAEREDRSETEARLQRAEAEVGEWRSRCEELRASRQEAVRELLDMQDQYKDAVALIQADLLDEATSREGMDRRLAELRAQLERLQAENAAEWGKRERLETEKLSLERENKRLRAELKDIQERLERRGRPQTAADADLRHLQLELSEKTKELADLKHSQNKLKKTLADKTTELAHSARRAEQYEGEVKRLRARVEELKRELAVAEDEVDSATNNLRKLQRTNDELQEQVEGLQVQIEHLQTRMRNSAGSLRTSTAKEEDPSDEDTY